MRFTRRASLSCSTMLLPALLLVAGCGDAGSSEPPLPPEALQAVVAEPGTSREKLARAIDHLFTREDIGETRAVVVMRGGKVVAERYGEDYAKDTRFLGWSMSKTITGVMIGMLVADGRLMLDESPPIPRWQRLGDPRGEITLRHLLQMRSGLRHLETSDPIYDADTPRMLFLDGRNDMARWAETQPLDAVPGREFRYSTATSVILADIAARVLSQKQDPDSRQRAVDDFLKARIFVPLGMGSAAAEFDASGTMIGGSMIHATARDWAKFGEFIRNKGSVRGAQLVPRNWVEFMARPSPRSPDYGAQLWLNREGPDDRQVLFADRGPKDLVGMVGHLGQYVLMSPGQKLTVVRLGKTDDAQRDTLEDALADVVSAYPRD